MGERLGPGGLRAMADRVRIEKEWPGNRHADDLDAHADAWERERLRKSDVSLISWDRLRALLAVEHTHGEGMNECRICDEPLTDAAADEIVRLRDQLVAAQRRVEALERKAQEIAERILYTPRGDEDAQFVRAALVELIDAVRLAALA